MEADYSIRVLQSRKKLIAAAPVKDPTDGEHAHQGLHGRSACRLHRGHHRRLGEPRERHPLLRAVDGRSTEQTRRIHERQRLMRTEAGPHAAPAAEAIFRRHWNAQRLLEPLPVVIPFADKLSFPTGWMRTRRDHARFLNLIEVSAFLHQHQREPRRRRHRGRRRRLRRGLPPRRPGPAGDPHRPQEAATRRLRAHPEPLERATDRCPGARSARR